MIPGKKEFLQEFLTGILENRVPSMSPTVNNFFIHTIHTLYKETQC